jgi:hypothetical protein
MNGEGSGLPVAGESARREIGASYGAASLDGFVQHVRDTNDYPSVNMHGFLAWAEAYISDLRQRCSAPAIDKDLAQSELWSPAIME